MGYSYYSCYCRECLKMDLCDRKSYDNNMAYCTAFRDYYNINSRACSKYFEYDEKRNSTSYSSCYLTTIISVILGYEDDCECLQILRLFREDFIKKNLAFQSILYEYDTIGPELSNCLLNDNDSREISKFLLLNYIEPIINLIKVGNRIGAIKKYSDMVCKLKYFYSIDNLKKEDGVVTGKGYLIKK